MNERSGEVNDFSPSSLSHIVGQKSVVEQVRVAIDAAFQDHRRMDSALMVGPPGCGKSALAKVIAAEMVTEFHEVLGQSVKNVSDLNALLLSAREKSVVHIDEAHELKKEFQTTLFLALDQKKLLLAGGKSIQGISIADFTLLLSTTDEYCLLQPLRGRMRLLLRFEFYSDDELTTVIQHRAKCMNWAIDDRIAPRIAKMARGTPRIALKLLQACHRVARSEAEDSIELKHLDRACSLEQIDRLGLGPTEQKYISILSDGPKRLNVIASLMGLPTRTVSMVTEPFLIRIGLIIKDDQGRRHLTAEVSPRKIVLTQFVFDFSDENTFSIPWVVWAQIRRLFSERRFVEVSEESLDVAVATQIADWIMDNHRNLSDVAQEDPEELTTPEQLAALEWLMLLMSSMNRNVPLSHE